MVRGSNSFTALFDALSRPHAHPHLQEATLRWAASFRTEGFTLLDACHDIVAAAIEDLSRDDVSRVMSAPE